LKQLIWLCLPLALCAFAIEPQITTEVSDRECLLGDPIEFKVRITYEDGWTFDQKKLDQTFGEATVLNQSWAGPTVDKDLKLNTVTFTANLAFYKLGEYRIPKLEMTAQRADGSLETFSTPELGIKVVPLLAEDDERMAPGKGQMSLALPALWPYLAGAAVLLALLLWLVIYFIRRRGRQPLAAPVIPPKPAYEEAIERLHDLTYSSLLKEGRYKEFYVRVSLIIRHYYRRLFQIPAEEMTSFELEEWFLDAAGLPDGFVDANRSFSERCDWVKYAKHDPVEAENKAVVNNAYQIAELLKPKAGEDAHVAVS